MNITELLQAESDVLLHDGAEQVSTGPPDLHHGDRFLSVVFVRNKLCRDTTSVCVTVSKTLRELVLEWSEEPVTLSQEVKMPQFTVKSVVAGHCQEWSVMGELT